MENRGSKGLALAALIVGVVGLTIGFAAFTASLTINPTADVSTTYNESSFQTKFGYVLDVDNGVAEDFAKAWTPAVSFVQDGNVPSVAPTVTKTATIKNESAYPAYTTNTSGTLTVKECKPRTGATEALVNTACSQISATYSLPATVPANGTAEVTVIVTGPTAQVDGTFDVEFNPVTLNYTTAG